MHMEWQLNGLVAGGTLHRTPRRRRELRSQQPPDSGANPLKMQLGVRFVF